MTKTGGKWVPRVKIGEKCRETGESADEVEKIRILSESWRKKMVDFGKVWGKKSILEKLEKKKSILEKLEKKSLFWKSWKKGLFWKLEKKSILSTK